MKSPAQMRVWSCCCWQSVRAYPFCSLNTAAARQQHQQSGSSIPHQQSHPAMPNCFIYLFIYHTNSCALCRCAGERMQAQHQRHTVHLPPSRSCRGMQRASRQAQKGTRQARLHLRGLCMRVMTLSHRSCSRARRTTAPCGYACCSHFDCGKCTLWKVYIAQEHPTRFSFVRGMSFYKLPFYKLPYDR